MPTTRTDLTIRQATTDDVPVLLPVLAQAFSTGTVAEWAVPEPADRLEVFTGYFRLMLALGLRHGRVDTTHDLSGAAIWYRHDETPPPYADHVYELEKATGQYAPKFLLLGAMFEARHPRLPHAYLAYLGVAPAVQNRGIGSALLTHAHKALDRENMPAYLEASDPRNRDLYARHGYQAGQPMQPTSDGPLFWPMWRGQVNGGVRSSFPPLNPYYRRPR
ncbi:GNAT family N-acetyltransferase [Micromonospora sp. NPDC050495]|uniref:GNAT family N-acetyltransferase n=1 Tax=Micromonospora sp. NPDC050495 TaxID=3154936 RepID=UPI0033E6C270